jgi:hypothetical protein
MNRRKFVTIGTTTLCAIPFVGFTAFNQQKIGVPVAKPKWLIDLILYNDEDVKQIASYKITDSNHKYLEDIIRIQPYPIRIHLCIY